MYYVRIILIIILKIKCKFITKSDINFVAKSGIHEIMLYIA